MYGLIKDLTQKQMNILTKNQNMMRLNFNEFIRLNGGGVEIPEIPCSPLFDDEKEVKKWLKRHNQENKYTGQYSEWNDD